MNITEAHAVDQVLRALDRRATRKDADLDDAEQAAVQLLRERAGKALLVSPDAIGRTAG